MGEALILSRFQLDPYLSRNAHSCTDRTRGILALDRCKNGLARISIDLVGIDLSPEIHSSKIPSEFLEDVFLPKMVEPGWQLSLKTSFVKKRCGEYVKYIL